MAGLHFYCSKILVIILDILYLGLGVAFLGIGIWLRTDKDAKDLRVVMDTFLGNKLSDAAVWLLIGVGIVVILVAVLGLIGAIFEIQIILVIFAVLLMLMIGLEVAACALAGIYKEDLFDDLLENMEKTIQGTYYGREYGVQYATEDVGRPWNNLQWSFECCGAQSVWDYGLEFELNFSIPFPYSCCALHSDANYKNALQNDTVDFEKCMNQEEGFFYSEPCYWKIKNLSEENTVIILGVAIGLACFTIFLFIFTICLCINSDNEKGN